MKKKGPRKPLPPEGLWISPEGVQHRVIEHLIEIQHHPEIFGLTEREVRSLSIEGLRDLAEGLISDGWIRFRYLSGFWFFEVRGARQRAPAIEQVLQEGDAGLEEKVVVSEVVPSRRDYEGTVTEFYDRTIFRSWETNPRNRWRLT